MAVRVGCLVANVLYERVGLLVGPGQDLNGNDFVVQRPITRVSLGIFFEVVPVFWTGC